MRVPVQTKPAAVAFDADGNQQISQPTMETLEFAPLTVAVTDLERCSMASNAIDHAAFAADHARRVAEDHARANDLLLVEGGPVSARRDPIRMATIYTYYGTPSDGAGNAITTNGTSITSGATLNTAITFDAQQIQGAMAQLQQAFTGMQTAASNAATVISNGINTAANNIYFHWDEGTGSPTYYAPSLATSGNLGGYITANYLFNGVTQVTETPEARASREAAERVWREEAAKREAKRVVVRQRADKLWLSHLTDEQRKTWLASKFVEVRSASGRRYRIKDDTYGNVYLLDQFGREARRYCAYANDPGGMMPRGDLLFAQLLMLQYDELTFLRTANTWGHKHESTPANYRVAGLPADGHADWLFVGQGVDADRELVEVAA